MNETPNPLTSLKVGPKPVTVLAWVLLAVLACLSVTLINGAPLYYFDSAGYLDNGVKVLKQLDVIGDDRAAAAAAAGADLLGDGSVNGSRSVFYSVVAAGVAFFAGPGWLPVAHSALFMISAFVFVNILVRECGHGPNVWILYSLTLLITALGSLPFYLAYFMPDFLTGLLLMDIAIITIFWRQIRAWEWVLVLMIGGAAVLSHPSHLLMSGLILPFVALAGLILFGRRWWVPVLVVSLLPILGAGERVAFSFAAKQSSGSEVVYYPFLTARLIQDRVGYDYLQEQCPNENIKTCQLFEALQLSDDPFRLTASHVLFETSPNLGSYRLMPAIAQRQVAVEQVRFAIQVALSKPVATATAVLRNTIRQARMNSIEMTIAEPGVLVRFAHLPLLPSDQFVDGRLLQDRNWIGTVNSFHQGVYLVSLLAIVMLMLWPGKLDTRLKVLVLLVAAGVLINAFVCGAISQPANRYGARVIWLLPFLSVLLSAVSMGWFAKFKGYEFT